ncbi:MAG: hypothetical protein AAGH76_17425 [Pseudomonadota bacterium]
MAFREKSAWVMAITLLIGAIVYFYLVASADWPIVAKLPAFVVYTAVLIALATIGHIAIAVFSPKEANASADEREKQIAHRASHIASYVLGAGVLLGILIYLVVPLGDVLFYVVFASLMLSHLADYVAQIVLYRS